MLIFSSSKAVHMCQLRISVLCGTNSFTFFIKTISYSWYVWLNQNYHVTIFSKIAICSSPGLTTSTPYSRLRWGISLFCTLKWASNPLSIFTIFEIPFLLLLVIVCLRTIHWLTVPQCPRDALASYFFNSGIYQWHHSLSFIIIWNQNLKSDILSPSVTQ